jgi:hypothetical protein
MVQLTAGESRFDCSRVAYAGAIPAAAGVVPMFTPGVHIVFAAASVLVVCAMSAGLEVATQVGPKPLHRHPITARVVLLTAMLVALAAWIIVTEL